MASLQPVLPNATDESTSTSTQTPASKTITTATVITNDPVYGLKDTAMDNYAHVDKPEHIRTFTFTMVLRRHHEQQTDSNFSSANFFTADSDTAIAIVSASREPFLISKTLHQKPTRIAPLQLNSRQPQAHQDDQATSTTTSDDTLPTSQNPSRRTQSPRAPQESAPGAAKDFAKTMANASLGANMRCSILARCTGARTFSPFFCCCYQIPSFNFTQTKQRQERNAQADRNLSIALKGVQTLYVKTDPWVR